jgi:hypothetical protein
MNHNNSGASGHERSHGSTRKAHFSRDALARLATLDALAIAREKSSLFCHRCSRSLSLVVIGVVAEPKNGGYGRGNEEQSELWDAQNGESRCVKLCSLSLSNSGLPVVRESLGSLEKLLRFTQRGSPQRVC